MEPRNDDKSLGPNAKPAGSSPALGFGYEVQKGDTLSKIAKRVYGDASRWNEIWEANKAQIPNPDLIHPGQQLSMPPRDS
jgi:nucleoid-associated protein YgaU